MPILPKTLLEHLDAGYNLARWLTRNDNDAKDILQEAFLRALKYSDSFRGNHHRAWFLKIVRNTAYTWLKNKSLFIAFDEEIAEIENDPPTPETYLLKSAEATFVGKALESMAVEFREILILREMEDLSYEEISQTLDIPIGTVMSRLSRARKQIAILLKDQRSQK